MNYFTAPQLQRPTLYYIQIGCMLAWLVVEALLDYILKFDFRQVRWMVISYVVLFFAGAGGMLGVAVNVGRIGVSQNRKTRAYTLSARRSMRK